VTNVTFIFQTSPNTNLYDKKVGGHGILCPPRLKKWGDTSPVSPTKLRPWLWLYSRSNSKRWWRGIVTAPIRSKWKTQGKQVWLIALTQLWRRCAMTSWSVSGACQHPTHAILPQHYAKLQQHTTKFFLRDLVVVMRFSEVAKTSADFFCIISRLFRNL